MREASIADFKADPVGRWTSTGSCVAWCASPELCGLIAWGRPDADEARRVVDLYAMYPRVMGAAFDVILDTRDIEVVDPDALAVVFAWVVEHRAALMQRVRMQASVIGAGANGLVFAGVLPALGESHPFRVYTDAAAAFRALAGEAGGALAAEVAAVAARERGAPRAVQRLRALLAARPATTLAGAARELGLSVRSLQRALARGGGGSFSDEVAAARLALAQRLLRETDAKLAVVAARVGISERALTLLFRSKTGMTPAKWRGTAAG